MTLPRGPADKLGNRYEAWWTLSEFVRMLGGKTEAIRIEDPGFEKAEFVVAAGSRREFHQAKRSHLTGKWRLATLQTEGLVEVIGRQLTGNEDRFVFVSGSDAPELVELCDAARDSESVEEFKRHFLATQRRQQNLKRLIDAWACDLPTARERLRRIDIRTIGEPELADKVRLGAQLLFLANPHRVVDTLRGIAGDSVHRTVTRHGLVGDLRRRGFLLRRVTDPAAAGAAIRTATDRFLNAARRRLIRGQLVPRSAAESLSSRLSPTPSCWLMLVRSTRSGSLAFSSRFIHHRGSWTASRPRGVADSGARGGRGSRRATGGADRRSSLCGGRGRGGSGNRSVRAVSAGDTQIMTGTASKRVFLVAGPNGAGKTTFATEFLPNEADCPIFVNADLIAAGLSPFGPARVAVEAGRLVLRQVDAHARQGHSFALETTLSGRGHARRIVRWRKQGYRVKLFFLRLATPEAAIARVAQRVSEGGHDVPEAVIRRRFHSGWRNFERIYRDLVDTWAVYDSSDYVPFLLEEGSRE